MDPRRFDTATRYLWTVASRRTAIGFMLGGIWGSAGLGTGEARKKHKKHKKLSPPPTSPPPPSPPPPSPPPTCTGGCS